MTQAAFSFIGTEIVAVSVIHYLTFTSFLTQTFTDRRW